MDKHNNVVQLNLTALATFVGIIFILLGVYTAIRVGVNIKMYSKYPTVGVLSLSIFNPYTVVSPRDEDCSYITPYYDPSGSIRPANESERENERAQKENCLKGISATRESTKTNDINTAIFFLFMGVGLFAVRRFTEAK